MSSQPPDPSPHRAAFAAALRAYIGATQGQRADRGSAVVNWTRQVDNWLNGRSLPRTSDVLVKTVGSNSRVGVLALPRLVTAYEAAAGEDRRIRRQRSDLAATPSRQAALLRRSRPDPAGVAWVAGDERFLSDRRTRPTDRAAAADRNHQQLRAAIRDSAGELARAAARLANTRIWGRLPSTAAAFHDLLGGDPLDMPDRLGAAYPLLLRLGQFLETDVRVQQDPAGPDDPLDADIHGLLTDLVRTAAPWLRAFPTVRRWDDEAGRALVRADLFRPARDFVRRAREADAITDADAEDMELLAEAGHAKDFQGTKAGNRSVGGAWNLMRAMALSVATAFAQAPVKYVAKEVAEHSPLVQRAGKTLSAAENEVEAFAATMPADLRQALRALVADLPGDRSTPVILPEPLSVPDGPGDSPPPDDAEEQARAMILAGRRPPAAWRPLIRGLDFGGAAVRDLSLLSGLTALRSLHVRFSDVQDVTPLGTLRALETLHLMNTGVADVSPLSRLTVLRRLSITGAPLRDIAPLAGLKALEFLDLSNTQVADVSPLAGLVALRQLDLGHAPVKDIGPLRRLAALQTLSLASTRVVDLAPLAGLTDLRVLYLNNTGVADVSPLRGLRSLESLNLVGTPVADVGPLDALTTLKIHWGGAAVPSKRRRPGRG